MAKRKIIREAGAFARHIQDGYCRTVDGMAWQYMLMPGQPSVRDASGVEERIRAARPMLDILTRLADLVPDLPVASRKIAKGFYRRIHILAVSGSRLFQPSPTLDTAMRARLAGLYPDLKTHDRFTLFGVQLTAGGGKGVKGFLQSIADEDGWVADKAFDADRERIIGILEAAGCRMPDPIVMKRALAWWPADRQPEALPVMIENDHLHAFQSYAGAFMAGRFRETVTDCRKWKDSIPNSYALTLCTLGVIPFKGEENTAPGSDWAATLLAARSGGGGGAVAVSVKGLVEPGRYSREQIDKDTDKVLEKAYEQANAGRKANLSLAQELKYANDAYQADGKPWPTLIEGRVHAAIPGIVEKTTDIPYPGRIELDARRQDKSFLDMMIGSDSLLEYNPSPVYWPAPILAYAGLNGRSVVGDDTGRGLKSDLPGAFVGLTEADRQPVYDSPWYASRRSGRPFEICLGSTGSGKTRLGLHIAAQWGLLPDPEHAGRRVPILVSDPKPDSDDFEPFVRRMNGSIYKLDRPEAKGILDPFRCIPLTMPDMITQMSVAMLSQITGGANPDREWEMGITSIVGYGLRHGAQGLGEAVRMAYREYMSHGPEAGSISPLVERITPELERAVLNDPLMPLIYATDRGGSRLSAGDGFTLISAGSLNIITDKEIQGAPTDVQRWVCRMIAIAASCQAIGRNGAVVIDEAWSLLQDRYGRSVVERMGRLARAQHYAVMMLSQKADEFVDAGLEDFVGKTYVLAIGARNEGSGRDSQAQAACRLANQPLDGRMHARMMHDRWLDPDSRAPDWESLYPLKDPKSGELLRGSIAYMTVGDAASAIPVEIRIDPTLA
ncbi:ATP-binding protein [Bifidobacterium sp. SO1]|uniref:ATP-binding protein n=1 Tax=Bifidobacterium sp. SO1 TaxID=2809029 RepID=UPI001BDC83DB|nr:ATP-binding protein [Bifidobacterium sp. SO1]MBT1161835.1 ATP-binding protein [Bifidobacterium sp. SO1]